MPPDGEVAAAPGTAAALRSRFSVSLTFFNRPPPTPPEARIDANTSSFPPVGFGSGGAFTASRPGGSGGGGGLFDGKGGGGGGLVEGNDGGGGPPLEGGPNEGTGRAADGKGGGAGGGGMLR